MTRWLTATLALLLGMLVRPAIGADDGQTLEIIELRHRLYDELRPVLGPLLDPGATLTGSGSRLIVRSTPANLAELRQAVAALDTRAQRLRITVSTTRVADSAIEAFELGARGGGVTIGTPPGADDGLSARIARTRGRDDGAGLHTVLTLDGQSAFVDTGEAVPQPFYSTQWGPLGGGVQAGVDHVEIRSGFHVTPRLRGDEVQLEISAQREDFARDGAGDITLGGVDTTLSGRLGEWLPLGGSAQTALGERDELVARTRRGDDSRTTYWIRVDLVP